MRRREFITLIGGAAAWPLAARAQQLGKPSTVGILGTATPLTQGQWVTEFTQRMRELGWFEARNLTIELRWGEGRSERFAEVAAEFVRLKVDVIVTSAIAIPAIMQATSTIPIVFPVATDPIGAGYVASLARPGGNVTGLSQQRSDTAGKRLELLREVVPGTRRLAIMRNVANTASVLEMEEIRTIAHTVGLEVVTHEIRREEDFTVGFEALKGRVEALYLASDAFFFTHRVRIITLARDAKLPTMYSLREYVEAGGLMSYGPNFSDMWRRAGDFVDKILRGAKPADIPVEQPTKFDLVINLTTAKTLGLEIPPSLLARADEVIE